MNKEKKKKGGDSLRSFMSKRYKNAHILKLRILAISYVEGKSLINFLPVICMKIRIMCIFPHISYVIDVIT